MPDLVNVIDAKWSPDAQMLAVVRFERRPSGGPAGYIEDEVLELLDMKTKQLRSLGSIEYGRPAWSPSGDYLAYWGNKADFLEVMERQTGEVIAKLTPTNPEFRWQGDTLLYLEKSTIRAWKGGRTAETLGRLGDTKVPRYPEDNWEWSGDGSRFTLTRYDQKDITPERFIGTTTSLDAEAIDLPGALYTEWAPTGTVLLVRYEARLEIRDLAADTVTKIDGGTGHLLRPVAGPIAQFFHLAHSGVDVAAPFGSPIVAADAGIVTKTGWQLDGEGGIRVCVQHSGGLETCYYHASAVLASVGDRVARGQAIALVGMSGLTRGPHVHWEAKLNGRLIDPLLR